MSLNCIYTTKRGHSAVSVLAVLAVFAIAGSIGWHLYKDSVEKQPQYQLQRDMIVVSPEQPEWIKADILEAVFTDQKLEEQYLTDRKLSTQLRDAFLLHPCIREV